jgi:hypothetical protein
LEEKKYFFSDSPQFPNCEVFYVDVAFIILFVDFYKMYTVRLNMTGYLTSPSFSDVAEDRSYFASTVNTLLLICFEEGLISTHNTGKNYIDASLTHSGSLAGRCVVIRSEGVPVA